MPTNNYQHMKFDNTLKATNYLSSSNRIFDFIEKEIYGSSEILFRSSDLYNTSKNPFILRFFYVVRLFLAIQEMVFNALQHCDIEIRSSMANNVVLSGGMFYHFIVGK
jgi:hypothetical protein